MALFVDNGGNNSEVCRLNNATKPSDERCSRIAIPQYAEIPVLLSNLMAVQYDAVVTPKSEFESLKFRHYSVDVIGYLDQAKGQHEHGMLRID